MLYFDKMKVNEMFKGFNPIFNSESRILILGSFPSIKSRDVGFYYGNKQNRFWKMLQETYNEIIGDSIQEKENFILAHNLALWDVIASSDLKGSLDTNLEKSNKELTNLSFILPPHTKIEKILCNGKTSYNILLKNYNLDIPIYYLPSTSSINTRYDVNLWKQALLK
jgi:hypoxanthine-DNA glycosylase